MPKSQMMNKNVRIDAKGIPILQEDGTKVKLTFDIEVEALSEITNRGTFSFTSNLLVLMVSLRCAYDVF